VSLERVGSVAEQKAASARTKLHHDQLDETLLRKLLEDHNRWTGSRRARELLDDWANARQKFVKVFPNEYKRALAEMHEREVELASVGNNQEVAMQHEPVPAK
jgi:glutamate synthase (NADPH/NADH) large chain